MEHAFKKNKSQMKYSLHSMIQQRDPVQGVWDVQSTQVGKLWCDASSLALGVCLEIGGCIVEDASWLRKTDDDGHINLAELEAVIRGINLSLSWGLLKIELCCDSTTVCAWMRSAIEGDKPVRVHGLSEALVRKRLSLIKDIISEYGLHINIQLVKSNENKADILTRVPQRWLQPHKQHISMMAESRLKELQTLHNQHHLGVNRSLFLARRCLPDLDITRREMEEVVKSCLRCCTIDPAPITWNDGILSVNKNWWRVACDVTHFGGKAYLTLVDCGPSRFAIWRCISDESVPVIKRELDEIFRERGPPWELLLDNAPTFRSHSMTEFCESWGTVLHYRCVNKPSGNGIVERNHRTIKRMASRTGRNILLMVFWYNMSPKEDGKDESVPANGLFSYEWKPPSIMTSTSLQGDRQHDFTVGQEVCVKPMPSKCTMEWPRGVVTNADSSLAVEVDGLPHHISDVRMIPSSQIDVDEERAGDTAWMRPQRDRRLPRRFDDYVL
jgi:transposase InsO family protein